MSKHIGIGACSAEGAALCYRIICSEAKEMMGDHMHPEVTMHTHSLGKYMIGIRSGNWRQVSDLMLSSIQKLKRCGINFAILSTILFTRHLASLRQNLRFLGFTSQMQLLFKHEN